MITPRIPTPPFSPPFFPAALRSILSDEIARGGDSTPDALRIRIAITASALAAGKDVVALAAARDAASSHPNSPTAQYYLSRALLRDGARDAAKAALERAAVAFDSANHDCDSTDADAHWSVSAAKVSLRGIASATAASARAADAYERGNFADAAVAYSLAVRALESATRDDKHGRAAAHANVAACLRRARKPVEAVEACDAALRLLPRFARALLRRAVCLLEAGKPSEAVRAFEDLCVAAFAF